MSMNSADNRNSTKVSKSSSYLSSEENELVFRLVGRRCVSQCTTVAQLYQTEGPTHSRWIKKHTGALCFIKDNGKRSYYCRMFCLKRHEVVWEQEMYDTIDIARTRPYLLTFEGQVMPTKRDNLHKMLK
jgi:neural Wiskott-Aldrich syndrome protein